MGAAKDAVRQVSSATRTVYTRVNYWSPVLLRALLWVGIAMMSTALERTEGFTQESMEKMTWMDWARLYISVFLAGAVTLRAFLDQSLSKHKEQKERRATPLV